MAGAPTEPLRSPADVGLTEQLDGLDVLEVPDRTRRPLPVRVWTAVWPLAVAVALFLVLWQVVVWSGWRDRWILPGPGEVLARFVSDLQRPDTWSALATTMRRAAAGFALAILAGGASGLAVSRSSVLRRGVGSLITGLQTMPSIAWFPLALVLFSLSEAAVTFVVVIGAAPSIANGVIAGVDHLPPLLSRVGRSLGARGTAFFRHVVIPGAMPFVVGGLKQGWAFAWRSLMAGELLAVVADRPSIGTLLTFSRDLADYPGMISVMLLVLAVGVAIDVVVFGAVERRLRRRRGLL